MATAVGMIGSGSGSIGSRSWNQSLRNQKTKKKKTICCVSASSSWVNTADPYKTLRVQPGASESEVRKAFRQLALQYHPDVCRGSNCGVQFSQINEAYDFVMSNLRGETTITEKFETYDDEPMRGMNDPDWDMWEEWMGWEGAGTLDYSSHINPYI